MQVAPLPVCRVTYSAKLLAETDREFETLLHEILSEGRHGNVVKRISATIFANSPTMEVIQVFEGPQDVVDELMEKIKLDKRFFQVIVINRVFAQERLFSEVGLKLGKPADFQMIRAALVDHPTLWRGEGCANLTRAAEEGNDYEEEKDLLLLAYSSCLAPTNKRDPKVVVDEIIRASVVNNRKLKVGGALCYNEFDQRFFQYLEGNKKIVEDLYTTISKDPRHINCTVAFARPVPMRSYQQWGMLWVKAEDTEALHAVLTGEINRRLQDQESEENRPEKRVDHCCRIN